MILKELLTDKPVLLSARYIDKEGSDARWGYCEWDGQNIISLDGDSYSLYDEVIRHEYDEKKNLLTYWVWFDLISTDEECAKFMKEYEDMQSKVHEIVDKALHCHDVSGDPEIGLDEEREVYVLRDYFCGNAYYICDLCGEGEVKRGALIEALDEYDIAYCF